MAVEIEIQQEELLKVRLLEEIFELGLCYYLAHKIYVILPKFGKVSLEVIEEGEGIVEISCEAVKIEVKTTVREWRSLDGQGGGR